MSNKKCIIYKKEKMSNKKKRSGSIISSLKSYNKKKYLEKEHKIKKNRKINSEIKELKNKILTNNTEVTKDINSMIFEYRTNDSFCVLPQYNKNWLPYFIGAEKDDNGVDIPEFEYD